MIRMIATTGFRTEQSTPSQTLLYVQQIVISSCDAMNNRTVAIVPIGMYRIGSDCLYISKMRRHAMLNPGRIDDYRFKYALHLKHF